MKISSRVHQIRIDFCVTEQVKRYVYVYLLEGTQGCYLIDSGTAGAENDIEAYMKSIGREPLKAVFLTHAHPDHIGAAHALQDKTGCRVYAGARAGMEHFAGNPLFRRSVQAMDSAAMP